MKSDKNIKNKKLPLMGWSSWNCFFSNINEANLLPQADALVSTGLADAGYKFFNIDDCYQDGRDTNGKLQYNAERFPNGMRYIADYIHSKGLYAGIYSDAGSDTCASPGYPKGLGTGLYGYEKQDLRQFFLDWDYDFIKVDWCGGKKLGLNKETQYTKIGNLIEEIQDEKGKDIVYNVCCWEFPGPWVTKIADSWRIAEDISYSNNRASFSSVLLQIDKASVLSEYQSPGHVNDPDMLIVGLGMTQEEDKSHFAMWCMLSAPLVLGNDLTAMTEETLAILKNEELIAIDQDPLVKPATLVLENNKIQVWMKPLYKGDTAVMILNRNNCEATVEISFFDLGFEDGFRVFDVWNHKSVVLSDVLNLELSAHGSAVYKLTGKRSEIKGILTEKTEVPVFNVDIVGKTKAEIIIENGGVLLDVREAESFEKKHISCAINIPFASLLEKVQKIIPDKNTPVVVCGSCHKRSAQSQTLLKSIGYTDVFDMGPMENWFV